MKTLILAALLAVTAQPAMALSIAPTAPAKAGPVTPVYGPNTPMLIHCTIGIPTNLGGGCTTTPYFPGAPTGPVIVTKPVTVTPVPAPIVTKPITITPVKPVSAPVKPVSAPVITGPCSVSFGTCSKPIPTNSFGALSR